AGELTKAEERLRVARQRHWGRRDRGALARAEHAVEAAHYQAGTTAARAERARADRDREVELDLIRAQAVRAVEPERAAILTSGRELSLALEDTRAARVQAAVKGEAEPDFTAALGPVPE